MDRDQKTIDALVAALESCRPFVEQAKKGVPGRAYDARVDDLLKQINDAIDLARKSTGQ